MTTENKIVHILQHAEANNRDDAFDPFDPPLSSKGANEARKLIQKFSSSMEAPTLVLAPPLKRCMETALKAFHPKYNHELRAIASKSTAENTKGNELKHHFAKGNVAFMLDPRLEDTTKHWYPDKHKGRIGMPSRQEMHSGYKRHFIFPEEFYPKYSEGQVDDPDKHQDWYKNEGMWTRGWNEVEVLERAASFKEFLYNRPESEIIIITCADFRGLLTNDRYLYKDREFLSCVWKPTVSGRMRLVALNSLESQKDIVEDDDYSQYWPYPLSGRSELFKKWHREPFRKILKTLFGYEERKKYLGLDKLTLDGLEAELGQEVVQEVKERVRGSEYFSL